MFSKEFVKKTFNTLLIVAITAIEKVCLTLTLSILAIKLLDTWHNSASFS